MLLLRDLFLTQTGKHNSTGVTFIALCFSSGAAGCGHDADAYCCMISAGQLASVPLTKLFRPVSLKCFPLKWTGFVARMFL